MHYDMQEQGEKLYGLFLKSYVVQRAKHDLCRCFPVQECYHAAYVFNRQRWSIRQFIKRGLLGHRTPNCSALVDKLHAKTVMKEFKIAWVKHYGWPEIITHDQGPEFMGNEFQNPAGAAGVLTMPIDSQSPGKMEKQKERDSR